MKIIKTAGYKESQGNPSLFDPFECAACGEQKEYEDDYAGLAKFTDGELLPICRDCKEEDWIAKQEAKADRRHDIHGDFSDRY